MCLILLVLLASWVSAYQKKGALIAAFDACMREETRDLAGRSLWYLGTRWMFLDRLSKDSLLYNWTAVVLEKKWDWYEANPVLRPADSSVESRRSRYRDLYEQERHWRYNGQDVLSLIPVFDDYVRKQVSHQLSETKLDEFMARGLVCNRRASSGDVRSCLSFLVGEARVIFGSAIKTKFTQSTPAWRKLARERCKISERRRLRSNT